MTPAEIRSIREEMGLTQQEFAERLGLKTRGAIAHVEDGRRNPTPGAVVAMKMMIEEFRKKRKKKTKSC